MNALDVRLKYETHIPVFMTARNAPHLNKRKMLVPKTLIIGDLIYILRRRINITPEQGLFLFCENCILGVSERIDSVDDRYRNADGFLYIVYALENVFG